MGSSANHKRKAMGKYGEAALRATELLRSRPGSAEEAWGAVVEEVFAEAPAGRQKACPREAFLGLCQAGLIVGVHSGRCEASASSRNRRYAQAAVDILKAEPELATRSKIDLWRRVMRETREDPEKKPNCQMDIVLALWRNGLIDGKA
jgi:hypothetical protein